MDLSVLLLRAGLEITSPWKGARMKATDAVKTALTSTQNMITWFLNDLSDADLLVRPTEGANHIAWQMGHLIASERNLTGELLPGASYPEVPAGFAERHANKAEVQGTTAGFLTKAQYVDLFNRTRAATLAAVDKLSDADLDKPTQGQMAKFAPNLGALLQLVANHTMMHGGQFSVIRRKLGKPVLF
jgi:uncharacterized damage-inducible protein DinB